MVARSIQGIGQECPARAPSLPDGARAVLAKAQQRRFSPVRPGPDEGHNG